MESMIKENGLTFKEIEQKIYEYFCKEARNAAAEFLEEYDRMLMKTRDKTAYRHKGKRQTTVKTVFGEVTYSRAIYEHTEEDGSCRFTYLLDETLDLKTAGLISENYAEKLVSGITTKSYRSCAEEVTKTSGQSISAMGVWNVVQALGETVCEEEKQLVRRHKNKKLKGSRNVPVLFEETDGVNIKLQGKDRRGTENGKAEMKVAIAYDGWKSTGKDRYVLDGKVAFAGFEKSGDFHKIREAKIAAEYDLDETEVRILNGDGATWIKKVPDRSTYFQLDPFHRNKAVKDHIRKPKAVDDIMSYFRENDISGMFRYLYIYRDSLSDDAEIKDAEELIKYFKGNEDGLLPYQKQLEGEIPESPKGLTYRNMGTMENHIWSIVAKRMKHNHTTWSKRGANNLAKLLAKKCEGKLHEVTAKLHRPLFEEDKTGELLGEILTAAKVPKKTGTGYAYPVMGTLPCLESALRGDGRKAFRMAGY